jgi:hypothetical protein
MASLVEISFPNVVRDVAAVLRPSDRSDSPAETWQLEAQTFYNGKARAFIEAHRSYSSFGAVRGLPLRVAFFVQMRSPYGAFARQNRKLLTGLGFAYRVNDLEILHRTVTKLRRQVLLGRTTPEALRESMKSIGRSSGDDLMRWLHGQGFNGMPD